MARLFSLNFNYQERQYIALISVSTSDTGPAIYTASVYDDNGQQVLPHGRLSFQNPNNLHSQDVSDAQAHELLESLSTALHHRLEDVPAPR